MDYFRKNIQILAARDSELARRLAKTAPAAADLIPTRAGMPSIRLHSAGGRPYTLHSTIDPVREAERLVESQYDSGKNVCLVYGFGLGYHLEELVRRLPDNYQVLVVEPQTAIFRLAMSIRDLSHLFADSGITWAVGENEHDVPRYFGHVFRVASMEGVEIIPHRPSVKLCGQYFQTVDQLCRKWIIAVGGNFLTNVIAVRTYLTNTLANILSIVDHPPVKRLFGRFRNVPGIVISAGPSLDRNMGLLRILEDHAVLICVDTALGPLTRGGVKPHLVLAGDPGEANFRHVQGLGETGAALVAEPMTHPRIVSEFEGEKFIMSFDEILMKNLSGILGDFGKVKAWGSISTAAFDLARNLGCDPIVFAGQDLAFSGGRYYAHGTYQEQRWLRELAAPRNLQDIHAWRMSKENDLDVEDVFGRPVRTSKALEAYKSYFEREIQQTGARVLNATEGGAGFAGVESLPLEKVLWTHARRKRPVREIIRSAHCERSDDEVNRLFDYLQKTAAELEKVQKHCNEGFEVARLLHQNESPDRPGDYRKLEQVYDKVYRSREVLTLLENANQGGLLAFQRGCEKLGDSRELDNETISEAARLYGSFFISFYQTAGLLRKRFQAAALEVGCQLTGASADQAGAGPDLAQAG